jgi:hypothetical protein
MRSVQGQAHSCTLCAGTHFRCVCRYTSQECVLRCTHRYMCAGTHYGCVCKHARAGANVQVCMCQPEHACGKHCRYTCIHTWGALQVRVRVYTQAVCSCICRLDEHSEVHLELAAPLLACVPHCPGEKLSSHLHQDLRTLLASQPRSPTLAACALKSSPAFPNPFPGGRSPWSRGLCPPSSLHLEQFSRLLLTDQLLLTLWVLESYHLPLPQPFLFVTALECPSPLPPLSCVLP